MVKSLLNHGFMIKIEMSQKLRCEMEPFCDVCKSKPSDQENVLGFATLRESQVHQTGDGSALKDPIES